jgi:hypothetical protein
VGALDPANAVVVGGGFGFVVMRAGRWAFLGRAAVGVAALALLMIPWTVAGRLYGGAVTIVARAALPDPDTGARLQFGPRAGDATVADPWQLPVSAEDPASGQLVATVLDLRRSGYLAWAVYAALMLVTPLRWPKRIALLVGGSLLLQLLPLLPLLTFFSGRLPVTVFELGTGARWVAAIAYRSLVAPPGMAFAVPTLLWLLLIGVVDRALARKLFSPASIT